MNKNRFPRQPIVSLLIFGPIMISLILRFIGFLSIDQLTKYFLYDLGRSAHTPLLHPILNTGISFSLPAPSVLIFVTVFLAIGYIGRLWYQKSVGTIVAALFFAGTIGNAVDRIFYAGVRDFLVIDLGGRFPGFICNVADIYLSLAICLLIYTQIQHEFIQKGVDNKKNTP